MKILVFCLLISSFGFAQQSLYGLHLTNNTYSIVKYDLSTATFQTEYQLPTNLGALWSLTYDPQSDVFYAFSNAAYSQASNLIRIDRCSGDVENLGTINLYNSNGGLIQSNICVTDGLAYDPINQLLYATINTQCNNPDANRFVVFDLSYPGPNTYCTQIGQAQDPSIDLDLIEVTNYNGVATNLHCVDASPQTGQTLLFNTNLVGANVGFCNLIQSYSPWTSIRGIAYNEYDDLLYTFAGQQGMAWLRTYNPNYLPNPGQFQNVIQFNLAGIQIRGLTFAASNCNVDCPDLFGEVLCVNFSPSSVGYQVEFSITNSVNSTSSTSSPIEVSFFQGNPTLTGELLGTQTIPNPLNIGETIQNLSFNFTGLLNQLSEVYMVVNLASSFQVGNSLDSTAFNIEECDYTNNIHVANLPQILEVSDSICAGQSVTYLGQVFDQTGNYELVLSDQNGCDSIYLNLNLTVLQNFVFDTIDASACNSYFWNGQTYLASGQYEYLIPGLACNDTLLVLNLEISQPIYQIQLSSCDSIFHNNVWLYQSTVLSESFDLPSADCDSIVETMVNISYSSYETLSQVACDVFSYNGINYISSGTFEIETVNASGCPHYTTLNLTVNSSSQTNVDTVVCGSFLFGSNLITLSGNYQNVFQNSSGCDSTVNLDIEVLPTHGLEIIRYTCDPNDIATEFLYLTNSFGCDSIVAIIPTPLPQQQRPTAYFSISPNPVDITNLSALSFINLSSLATSYHWSIPGIGYQSTAMNATDIQFNEVGIYDVILTVYNDLGCSDSYTIQLIIEENVLIYVPNTFTPDGNAHNNIFVPVFSGNLDMYNYELLIFNRWGELIFQSYHPLKGWDGTYDGKPVPDGTYIWKINYNALGEAKRESIVGHVNVLR